MSIKNFKTRYKYGSGIKILSPAIGGVCTLPSIRVLQTFQSIIIISTISPNLKWIHVIMSIYIFIAIIDIVYTYPHINLMS
jgi:hypothetical protein